MTSLTCGAVGWAEEFTWTTFDEEQHQFTVIPLYDSPPAALKDNSIMPSGVYRVVDGELRRIITGMER